MGDKMVYYAPMKHLYDSLRGCAKEEEVKAEFCKFFKMKIFALRGLARRPPRRANGSFASNCQ